MLPFPPTHPPCRHLAHPLRLPPRSARAVIVAANASNPGLFSAKSGIAGSSNVSKVPVRQKWQQTPHHSEHLHFMGAPGGSRWLQVDPGGSRWIQVAPGGSRWIKVDQGGSRWFQAARNPHKYPQLLHILDFERKNSASGKSA